MVRITKGEALEYLEECIDGKPTFRDQQWEAIDRLANKDERLLLVQRTGWGKSIVYFIATKVLRDHGTGPTLIISPLLSLMRDQVKDAEADLDLDAASINSANVEEWDEVKEAVRAGECDLLLISPERLANRQFRLDVLEEMEQNFGMLVIDEAHCISNWGHDFRPDYRRIKEMVMRLPDDIPIAATTATANDKVVEDVSEQIPGMKPLRGSLMRDSLQIQAIHFDEHAVRLAWLAQNVSRFRKAGIIYCLTHDDVQRVSTWLSDQGIEALPYHGGMEDDRLDRLESRLMDNEVDALVATNALGMGFNKPDLEFVIHFQRPPNLIRYYQEIGRAGRDLDEAYAVVLSAAKDDEIARYFIENSFPEPEEFEMVLETIETSDEPLYQYQLLKRIDLSYQKVDKCLDILRVEGALERVEDGFVRTAESWSYDYERYQEMTEYRWEQLERMQEFMRTDRCLMRFIDEELDGQMTDDCGQCANCAGPILPEPILDTDAIIEHRAENLEALSKDFAPGELLDKAEDYLRDESWQIIEPRSQLPQENDTYETIPKEHKLKPGRALSMYGEFKRGKLIQKSKKGGRFDTELIDEAAEFIENSWEPTPEPTWVTAVPSPSNEGFVYDGAAQLADRLALDFVPTITQIEENEPQRSFENSYQQCWNVKGVFEVVGDVRDEPVLLVDDLVGSRWTLTEVGRALRKSESGPVVPFTFAKRPKYYSDISV